MRIPIYTVDFCDKCGFKRIAKKLQRSWPSVIPLMLSSAQEILSRGFGYRDLHDLRQSSDKFDRLAPVPTQSEVRDGISTSIFVFCRSREITDIDENDVAHLVTLLPLQELSVYQHVGQGETLPLSGEELLKPSEGHRRAQSPVTHRRRTEHVDQPNSVDTNRNHTSRPLELISLDGLKSLWEVVLRRGSFRDQSLFAILLQGIRPHEVRATKAHDISSYNSHTLIRLYSSKAPEREFNVGLPPSSGASIARYIRNAGLSENDYLFPSASNATLPMRADEMNKIIVSYLHEALGNDAQMSAHKIRQSVAAIAFEACGLSLSQVKSHLSHHGIPPYLIGQKKPKE
ncbi:tyrosine-type recombinase/integrase [Pseudomonas violetae]|uniref:Tyrosine-type recombinase/integrase n=1 Tax=Pseudomonas violetae TaxID=2915813 RepID=A0ABT0F106_9PSED|nr:tyrosine-type recombinase/integrase [Pseudomonas violetae]MCK1791692.1 tyrosine-type recombinase/integrase [Pseudomonas violetae]